MLNVLACVWLIMFKHPKIFLALAFMLLSVLVDFTSTILSVVSDGLLIGVAGYLIYLALKEVSSNKPPQ